MKKTWIAAIAFVISNMALAQPGIYKEYGEYRVFFSVFNSSFIDPSVAQTYGLKRGPDDGLVNIAMVKGGDTNASLGLETLLRGRVQNLIMQSQVLNFTEIRDGQAVYYLAPFSFDNDERLNFFMDVHIPGQGTKSFSFSRTMYED